VGDQAVTSLSVALTSSHRHHAAEYRHKVYLANGWGVMQRWDGRGSALVDAGITGPSTEADSWVPAPTTAAGDTSLGVHTVRYRYMDSTTGYVSEASEEREITVASGAEELTFEVDVANKIQLSADAKVDRIVIEMTVVGGAEFFKAAEGPNTATNIVVDLSDESLVANLLPWPEAGHKPPPVAEIVVAHAERLWIFGQVVHSTGTADFTNASTDVDEGTTDPEWDEDTLGASAGASALVWLIQKDGDDTAYEVSYADNANSKLVLKDAYGGTTSVDSDYKIFSRADVIWVSNPAYPEGFTPTKWIDGPVGEMSGALRAGIGYSQSMIFFSLSGMYRFSWDQGPLVDPWWTALSNKRGAISQRVVIEVDGTVFSMDRLGFHAWSGVFPRHISRPIDDVLNEIDWDQSENFHAVFFPRLRAIRWYVCFEDETEPKHFVQLDVDRGTWGTGEHEVGISESRLVPTLAGPLVYLGDENGHLWLADTGTCDGCDGDYSPLTVRAGATTTWIPVEEQIPTTNAGLAGCMAHHVEGDESQVIASNTGYEITLDEALAAAPEEGDTIWVGSIPSKLKTKAFPAATRGMRNVARWGHWWIKFNPISASRLLRARLYADLSSSAFSSWGAASEERDLPGATFPGNNSDYPTTDWLVALSTADGIVRIGFGDFERTVEIELEINEPDAELELIGLEFQGEEGERVR